MPAPKTPNTEAARIARAANVRRRKLEAAAATLGGGVALLQIEPGANGKRYAVLRCPICEHEEAGERLNESAVTSAVFRMAEHLAAPHN